ncbi:476_t:CDS:1 [Racocetra persica]|uniref:476_t:CDS:1 n=1 Tax=Racocetra persica TaxID=160502 RepID=A0ACA9LKH8_9GLOM|nr:476_t:CDS:1 [Racocetra persica]
MTYKISSRLYSLLLILLITITLLDAADPITSQSAKIQSSKHVIPATQTSVSQVHPTFSASQSSSSSPTPTQKYNYDYNSLPGNPDPDQIKVITATTIKHYGTNRSAKPTGIAITHAESGAANKRAKFGVVLGMIFVRVIVLLL